MTKLRNVHFHRHSLKNVSIDFVIVFVIIIRFLFSYRLVFVSEKTKLTKTMTTIICQLNEHWFKTCLLGKRETTWLLKICTDNRLIIY
jgi:hypothetical protein